jgi:hypothetical protein
MPRLLLNRHHGFAVHQRPAGKTATSVLVQTSAQGLVLFLLSTLLWALALARPLPAWDQHHTFTGLVVEALQTDLPLLRQPVKPMPLSAFLKRHAPGLKTLLADFYTWKKQVYSYPQWLLTPESEAWLYSSEAAGKLTEARFKELLGVRSTAFGSVDVPSSSYPTFAPAARSFGAWVRYFSDEPDWGMDQGLFGKGDPRYTEIPYGDIDKLSSQAPFHMYFGNENAITYAARPSLKQSMTLLRFSLFQRLAAFALARHEWFWGARFLGCALHYLQDVAMPYHASALPYATVFTYLKYAVVKDKQKFLADNMQLLSNRHFAYEAFAYRFLTLAKERIERILPEFDAIIGRARNAALGSSAEPASDEQFLVSIFKRVAKAAYKHARPVDKVIGKTFEPRLVKDPTFDPASNEEFKVETWLTEALLDDWVAGKRFPQKALFDEFRPDLIRTLEASTILLTRLLAPVKW